MAVSFEWNDKKNQENIKKHGVAFETAQYAFLDQERVIAEDIGHSAKKTIYETYHHIHK